MFIEILFTFYFSKGVYSFMLSTVYILRLFKTCIVSYYSTSCKWLGVECYLSLPFEAKFDVS